MGLLTTLAQVKEQLEAALISCPKLSSLISVVNSGNDVYTFLADELSVTRSCAKETFIGLVYKTPGLEDSDVGKRLIELCPELRSWYAEPSFYVRYWS